MWVYFVEVNLCEACEFVICVHVKFYQTKQNFSDCYVIPQKSMSFSGSSEFIYLFLTGSRRNAMMDDDKAELLWRPESVVNSSSQEGNLVLWLLLFL